MKRRGDMARERMTVCILMHEDEVGWMRGTGVLDLTLRDWRIDRSTWALPLFLSFVREKDREYVEEREGHWFVGTHDNESESKRVTSYTASCIVALAAMRAAPLQASLGSER